MRIPPRGSSNGLTIQRRQFNGDSSNITHTLRGPPLPPDPSNLVTSSALQSVFVCAGMGSGSSLGVGRGSMCRGDALMRSNSSIGIITVQK